MMPRIDITHTSVPIAEGLKCIATLAMFLLLLGIFPDSAKSQDIPFGQYGSYALMADPITPGDLNFGTLISGSGQRNINLGDPDMLTIQITAVRYLDIFVTITPPAGDAIVLMGDISNAGDPDKSIPLTLEAAYANRGIDNPTGARVLTGLAGLFPVFQRQSGPPGPPPTPPHEGYVPPMESAYLYIFGSLNVGNVDAGPYSGEIVITVEYN